MRERERDIARAGEGRERETQNPKQAPGSDLSAQEPKSGTSPLILDFGLGRDLKVCEIEPHAGLHSEGGACLGFFLCVSFSVPPLLNK